MSLKYNIYEFSKVIPCFKEQNLSLERVHHGKKLNFEMQTSALIIEQWLGTSIALGLKMMETDE